MRRKPRSAARLAAVLAALAAFSAAGCRQGMFDQPKVKPLAESAFFADGAGARPLPAHTVARGHLKTDRAYWTGVGPDGPAVELPVPLDAALLARGQKVFNVFCSPCHDRTGGGDGMIVQRGYKRPTSFHDPRLLAQPVGHFVRVMTDGFGQMPSYASQVPVEDRWAVAAYIRALQSARRVPAARLTAGEREQLDRPAASAGNHADPAGGHGGHAR